MLKLYDCQHVPAKDERERVRDIEVAPLRSLGAILIEDVLPKSWGAMKRKERRDG